VQASWSSGAIEQHGDTRGTRAHFNHYATPASQLWASSGSNFTHLKAGTDNNSVDLVNHYRNPVSGKWIDKKAKIQIEDKSISDQSSLQPAGEMAPQTHVSRRDLAAAQTPEHPLLAHLGPQEMSAYRPLLVGDRTSVGRPSNKCTPKDAALLSPAAAGSR